MVFRRASRSVPPRAKPKWKSGAKPTADADRADATGQQRRHCGFLDLPPELRNTIYEMAFTDRFVIKRERCQTPGLLLACKQIKNEALMAFYSNATFYFEHSCCGVHWYAGLPEKSRDAIKHMHLHYNQTEITFDCRRLLKECLNFCTDGFWYLVEEARVQARPEILVTSEDLRSGERVCVDHTGNEVNV